MFYWFWLLNVRAFHLAVKCSALFLLAACLFAYGGAHLPQADRWAGPYLHMAFMFSMALGINGIFEEERREGVLDQWHLWPWTAEIIMLWRAIAHWVVQLAPLIACVPLAAIFMQMPTDQVWRLTVTLALVSLVMLPIALVIELLATQKHGGSAAPLLLILPIYLPVMLFGLHASESAHQAASTWGLLAGLALVSWPVCLWICGRMLRHLP